MKKTLRINARLVARMLQSLWRDQSGAISALGIILITTIVAIGAMVGLVTVRDQIVQQFGDVAVALEALDQSYSYNLRRDVDGDMLYTGPKEFQLANSFTEDAPTLVDPDGGPPACLTMTTAADPEGP